MEETGQLTEILHQRILYEVMMEFGQSVKIALKKGADQSTRDAAESYLRQDFSDELSGVFQLVLLWKAIGHTVRNRFAQLRKLLTTLQTKPAGPARDVIKNVLNLNAAMGLLKWMSIVGQRIDNLYKTMDPQQHAFLVDVRTKLKEKYPAYEALGSIDPTVFHGRSLIYNRSTPLHTDRKDPKPNLTPVLTLGEYTLGILTIPSLGLKVDYGPGTLVMLRGGFLPHEVTYHGGQRVSIAHFMHAYMLKEAGIGAPPLTAAQNPSRPSKREVSASEQDEKDK